MRNARQGGSVLGFILGGVLLTALLIGGVYMLRQKSHDQVGKPVVPVKQPIRIPSESSPQPRKEDTKKTDMSSSLPSDSVPSSPPQPQRSHTATSQSQLPQTGPAESIVSAFVLAILCGVTLSYVRSRQLSSSL